MAIRRGDIGKIIQLNAGIDISANTDLALVFTKPNNEILTVTSADGVVAPGVDSGTFLANQYWQYSTQDGDIDRTGDWQVNGRYIDAQPTNICSAPADFTVLDCP